MQNPVHVVQDFYYIDIVNQKNKGTHVKKENIEKDYDLTLDTKFIEKVGSPFDCDFPILGTEKFVKPVKDKKILVIRLEGAAELYALNNSVTYITNNKEKYDKFLNTVNHEKFGSDDSAILFNDWKNIDKLLKENNMKFDVCIMNPPYDRGFYVSVISKALTISTNLVSINPAHQFFDWHNLIELKPKIKANANVFKNIVSFELVDSKHGPVFDGASIDNQLCVLHYDKTIEGIDYRSFNLVKTEYLSIFCKTVYKIVKDELSNLHKEILKFTDKTYKLPVPRVHGHVNCKDWTEVTSADYIRAVNSKLTNNWHVSFDTEQERKKLF